MNDNTNFSSILDEAPTEVIRPQPLPVGTYLCRVTGQPRYDKSKEKGTQYVEFTLVPIDIGADVAEDDVADAGGLDGKTFRHTLWLTPDAIFMLDQFHVDCGLELDEGISRRIRNDECINQEVLAVIKHTASPDGTRTYTNVTRTAPV